MKKSLTNTHEGALTCDYESRCARVEELQRSNRRVALMALLIAVALMAGSAAYITWSDNGPDRHVAGPQQSSIGFTTDTR